MEQLTEPLDESQRDYSAQDSDDSTFFIPDLEERKRIEKERGLARLRALSGNGSRLRAYRAEPRIVRVYHYRTRFRRKI